MKLTYKFLFKASKIGCLVIFLNSIIFAIIGLGNLLGDGQSVISFRSFVMDMLNTEFVAIICILSIISMAFIVTLILSLEDKADKFEKLDDEIFKLNKTRQRLNHKINQM